MGRSCSRKVEYSDFYCINCGNKITLPRKLNLQKKAFHRKRLYCPFCKKELNFVECRNSWEAEEFKEDFENGVFIDECNESIEFCN